MYTAWNNTVKLVWGCPVWTRTNLVQQLLCCGHTSAKVDILNRFVKFFHSLRFSISKELRVLSRYLARDVQSVLGRNLRLILDITHLDPWTTSYGKMKAALITSEMVEVPEWDKWRLPYLWPLLAQKREAHFSAMEDLETTLDNRIQSLLIN